jgi:Tol biopolymer transport system component
VFVEVRFTATNADAQRQLYVRPLDSLAAQPVSGTEGAFYPFWSPDSRYVAFSAGGKLKKVDAQGGPPLTLCDSPGVGTWSRDNVILFQPARGPIYRVSAAGGQATPAGPETDRARPQFLPDGRHFIYYSIEGRAIYAASLDSKETKRLVAADSTGIYTEPASGGSGPGYVLFLRGDTLMAQPFDSNKLEMRG